MKNKTVLWVLLLAILGFGLGYTVATATFSDKPKKIDTASTDQAALVNPPPPSAINRPGIISVVFDETTAKVGQPVTAQLSINTQGEAINGFDILLKFNPSNWQVAGKQVAEESVTIAQTNEFSLYPQNTINTQQGEINFSGLTDIDNTFTGELIVGQISLIPQQPGELELEIVFTGSGETRDSNLAQTKTGEDILGEVISGKLIVTE